MSDPLLVVAWLAGGALALWLGFKLARVLWLGIVATFGHAASFGIVGLAIYVALWVFLAPLMLVYCLVAGVFARDLIKTVEKAERAQARG